MPEMINKKEIKILKKSTIEFELEQMTPMIHFQGEEEGAGIRASDLKPRFDAFLKRYLYDFGDEETKEKIKKYILKQSEEDNEKIAFDYKVKVINEEKNDVITFYKGKDKKGKNTFHGSFYGELEDGKNSSYNCIKVIFITANKELKKDSEKDSYLQEKIKGLFPVFLAVNGFGLRNNKGYGYFKQKKDSKKQVLEHIQKYQKLENQYVKNLKALNEEKGVGIYQLEIKNEVGSKNEKIQRLLDEIKSFHQVLKSGINFNDKNNSNNNGKYIPSFMLKRSKIESGATLEKKALKLFLKKKEYDIRELTKRGDISKKDKFDDLDMKKLYYVRGLLGLAPFYEFRKVKKNEKDEYGFTARFNVEIKGVERYASPIKYLPISENQIIILVDYSKIEEFRREAREVSFTLKEVSGTKRHSASSRKDEAESIFYSIIPSEDQYSIHQLFKKSGVIEESLKQYAEEMKKIQQNREWKYSVISDIEIG